MDLPKEFFTIASLSTMSGLVGLTYVITNGLAQAFGVRATWLGLVVAIFLVEVGVVLTGQAKAGDYLIAIGNGFLVYLAAGGAANGVQSGLSAHSNRQMTPQSSAPTASRHFANSYFFARWF